MDFEDTAVANSAPAAESFGGQPGELKRGVMIGRYLLLDRIGAGGMGIVYAAYDPELDRKVALKLLVPRPGVDSTSEGRARLLREAQALARLSHPNVVTVHDVGTHGGQVWIAMEFVAGETLGVWATGGRSWSEILQVLVDAARGVAAAHATGLVHRDLKPDNVMIGRDGRVRVMDFGLAHGRAFDTTDPELTTTIEAETNVRPELAALALRLTAVGAIQGTPAYMAPEQWQAREVGPATDQFGWSVMAWELLYGERPFAGDTMMTLAAAVLAGRRRPPPRGGRVPGWVQRTLERGLETQPARRWATMAELLVALRRGEARSRTKGLVAALLGVTILGAGIFGHQRWQHARAEAHEQRVLDERVAVCDDKSSVIDKIWNVDARQQLLASFAATQLSYADATARTVIERLDAQAESWRRSRREACLNAEVHNRWTEDLLDRSLWCLEDRRIEFEALAATFSRADDEIVTNAVAVASDQPSVEPCVDERLLRRQPTPPMDRLETLHEVRAELARVGFLRRSGDFEEALRRAIGVRARTDELGWLPLASAAQVEEARLLSLTEDHVKAESVGADAYFLATGSGSWEVAVSAAELLIGVVGQVDERAQDARIWARHAQMAADQAGGDSRLSLAKRKNILAVLESDPANALALYAEALALSEDVLGPQHPDNAAILDNMAMAEQERGDFDAAIRILERSLSIIRSNFGEGHPRYVATLLKLGGVSLSDADYIGAAKCFEQVLSISDPTLGSQRQILSPSDVNDARYNLAVAYYLSGDFERAIPLFREALSFSEGHDGPEHSDLAYPLNGLGAALVALGRMNEARPFLERALTIRRQEGEGAIDLGEISFALARSIEVVDPQRAIELAREARRNYEVSGETEVVKEIDAWLARMAPVRR